MSSLDCHVGEYWVAVSENEELIGIQWLILIVLQSKWRGKIHSLGVKCNWKTKRPMVSDVHTHWFDSKGMETNDQLLDLGLFLVRRFHCRTA